MTTTDLKPGDVVQHPEKGSGIVRRNAMTHQTYIAHNVYDVDYEPLTGWERVETVRPGHVQVRVDDLDLSRWEERGDNPQEHPAATAASRAAKAKAAQRAESTPPADEPERAEKPTSTTVTLPCPDCGEEIAREVRAVRATYGRPPKWHLEFMRGDGPVGARSHTCKPEQPDEPTEFGARVTVTCPDGTREKWLRTGIHNPWQCYLGNGEMIYDHWDVLCRRGTITLGWDE